jgi:glyoxylase-like metal-dependent hydrolase (beta-lactamase superfamily II)
MLDETTGVLFASDMIFFRRALTTPHTPGLDIWLSDLTTLASLKYDHIVPGHGPLDTDHQSITEMVDYIRWLDATLKQAAEQGLSMNEVMSLPIDERFKPIALAKSEFVRTVFHLYAEYEAAQF